jgi:hypothetical protein
LVSLTEIPRRMTMEEIERMHPRLIGTLTSHPGIGWVMVRSDDDGTLVLGSRGSRRLQDDAIRGDDPLRDFGFHAADHLRRTDRFPHCPDLLVHCMYDAEQNEVAPFEEFMGSHGGIGGWQSRPFALAPIVWGKPRGEIVGARAMHEVLRGWLEECGLQVTRHAILEPRNPVWSATPTRGRIASTNPGLDAEHG